MNSTALSATLGVKAEFRNKLDSAWVNDMLHSTETFRSKHLIA